MSLFTDVCRHAYAILAKTAAQDGKDNREIAGKLIDRWEVVKKLDQSCPMARSK
jgi:hypothetical protein